VEEEEEEKDTAVTVTETVAEDVREAEDMATATLRQLQPNTKAYVLPLAITYSITARRERPTR
jgi:hypothetical protein